MHTEDLHVHIGDCLQLEHPDARDHRKFTAKVIGYLLHRSLVITVPRIEGKIMLMREGQVFVVRMLSGHNIYAFTTTVLASCSRPYPYVHLSYPREVEAIVVRKSVRARANLLSSVYRDPEASQPPVPSVIVDISTTGAMLRACEILGEVDTVVTASTRIEVAGVEHSLELACRIRNVRKQAQSQDNEEPAYLHGVEFQLLDDRDTIAIHGFVYQRLSN